MSKVISDRAKNVKLYINSATCSSWNHCYMWNCTWSAFISQVICLGKTSKGQTFLGSKILCRIVCAEFSMKTSFFPIHCTSEFFPVH